mgnify:CR=1 FL=1
MNPPSTPNGPDNYRVKISSVQNPSVSTPIMTLSEFDIDSSSFTNGCKDGFRTVIDIPVENLFHRGSVLWVIFPKELGPEGAYEIQFKAKNKSESFDINAVLFANNTVSFYVNSSQRLTINYQGVLKEISE